MLLAFRGIVCLRFRLGFPRSFRQNSSSGELKKKRQVKNDFSGETLLKFFTLISPSVFPGIFPGDPPNVFPNVFPGVSPSASRVVRPGISRAVLGAESFRPPRRSLGSPIVSRVVALGLPGVTPPAAAVGSSRYPSRRLPTSQPPHRMSTPGIPGSSSPGVPRAAHLTFQAAHFSRSDTRLHSGCPSGNTPRHRAPGARISSAPPPPPPRASSTQPLANSAKLPPTTQRASTRHAAGGTPVGCHKSLWWQRNRWQS